MKDEDFVNSLLDLILADIEKSVVPWRKEIKPGNFGICHERENKIDWSNPASYCLESTILVKISKKNGKVSIGECADYEYHTHNIFRYNIKLLISDSIIVINGKEYGGNFIKPYEIIVREKMLEIYRIYESYVKQLEDKSNEILLKALQ